MQELFTTGVAGLTLDAYVYAPSADLIYRTDTHVFETPISGNWSYYFISLTETSGSYYGNFPTAVTQSGVYPYTVRVRSGGSSANTDAIYASGSVFWDGQEENGAPLTEGNVTNRSFIKTQNGWTDSSYDSRIDQLLPVITESINKFLRRRVNASNRIEVRNGQGKDWIRVYNPPVNAITSITFDFNGFSPKVVTGSNFVYDTDQNVGMVKFKTTANPQYGFADGFQNIQIQYNGGFAAIPYDIQSAAALVVRKIMEMSDEERLVVEKVEGSRKVKYDQTYISGGIELPVFAEAKQLLLPYQLVRCF